MKINFKKREGRIGRGDIIICDGKPYIAIKDFELGGIQAYSFHEYSLVVLKPEDCKRASKTGYENPTHSYSDFLTLEIGEAFTKNGKDLYIKIDKDNAWSLQSNEFTLFSKRDMVLALPGFELTIEE